MNVKITFLVLVIFMTLHGTLSKRSKEGKGGKCKGKKKALCAQIATLSEQRATWQADIDELKNENEALKSNVEDQKKEIEQLKKELEDCESGPVSPYQSVGCFKDTGNRAIPTLEGQDPLLDGGYQQRHNAIQKCYQAALKRGFEVFAIQHSGWCASGPTAKQTYNKYGGSSDCGADGEGGPWANEVYEIEEPKVMPYQSLGCFKDTGNRAIPTLEGQDPLLDGGYQQRHNAIQKCYQAALKRGFEVFAIQHSGWCASGPTAKQTYNKYGGSSDCGADGEGGPWANEVYEIKEE